MKYKPKLVDSSEIIVIYLYDTTTVHKIVTFPEADLGTLFTKVTAHNLLNGATCITV